MILTTIHGEGPVRAIALHGWFGDHRSFDAMLAGIDPGRFSIAVPDIRGYGSAHADDGPFDMATIARDVIALADRLGWDHFSVIGHSMGGKAALKAALLAPGRVERLIGVAPVWAGAAPFDVEVLGLFRAAADDVAARRAIIDLSTGHRLSPYWVATVADRSVRDSARRAFAAYLESWALEDFAAETATLTLPVLLVGGTEDQGVPESWLRATWLEALPHAELIMLPDCGHYPPDEAPLRLARHIDEFLGRVGGGRTSARARRPEI